MRWPVTAAGRLEPPLAEEKRPLVQVGRIVGERDALDHPAAPEWRLRHRDSRRYIRTDIGRHSRIPGLLARLAGPGSPADPPLAQRGQLRARVTALDRHEGIHQAQALEGIAGVPDLAVEEAGQVLLDIGAGQRGAAEQHRPAARQPPRVQLGQVVPHHDGGLHQQAGHPDDIGVLLGGGVQDGGDGLLDADVDDVVTVVGQDDVDQVLADVMHVALDGGQHDPALAVIPRALHVRLQVPDGSLHHLGGLQHERQLHLAGAEQVTDGLHAVKQHVVDDFQGRPAGQRGIKVRLQPDPLAVDDPPLQPLPER